MRTAKQVIIPKEEKKILRSIANKRNKNADVVERSRIILQYKETGSKKKTAESLGSTWDKVNRWVNRWNAKESERLDMERMYRVNELTKDGYQAELEKLLQDDYRCGAPVKFTESEKQQIIALATQKPEDAGVPITHWSYSILAQTAIDKGIVKTVSRVQIGRFLKQALLQPHKSNYWEHPNIEDWDDFCDTVIHLCDLHSKVETLATAGQHIVSVDEKPGMQALERENETLPMAAGKGEKREFNYIRHGTQVLIGNLDLATGEMISPTIAETRTEKDFVEHITQTVELYREDSWIFLMDQLNTHKSASLVEYVAKSIGDSQELGIKGESGILKSMDSRMAYLSDPSHRIRFEYTPKHCSWLNPIEVWFSILSSKVLRRGNFSSTVNLKQKILNFIDYFNEKLAHPFSWAVNSKEKVQVMLQKISAFRGLFVE